MDFYEIPAGFSMALAMNPPAWNAYSAMTEAEKQTVLKDARNAGTRADMHRIISSLAGFQGK